MLKVIPRVGGGGGSVLMKRGLLERTFRRQMGHKLSPPLGAITDYVGAKEPFKI